MNTTKETRNESSSDRVKAQTRNATTPAILVFGPRWLVRQHSETDDFIGSLGKSVLHSSTTKFVRPFERMYVMQIARFIATVVDELTAEAHHQRLQDIPFLSEFFGHWRNDDAYFRSKKNWSKYSR